MGRIFRMGWFVDGGCCQNRDLGDFRVPDNRKALAWDSRRKSRLRFKSASADYDVVEQVVEGLAGWGFGQSVEGFSGYVASPGRLGVGRVYDLGLAAYTVGSAASSCLENPLGRIAPGMLADLALFGEDIQDVAPSEIHTLRPAMTFLGGKVVTTR